MNEGKFVAKRSSDWARLNALTDRAEHSLNTLSMEELTEFVRLYRRAAGDLARARTRFVSAGVLDYLNATVGRAYGALYRAPRKGILHALGEGLFLAASAVRRRAPFVLFSTALFFGSGLFAFILLKTYPGARDFFVPDGFAESFKGWTEGTFEKRSGSENLAMTGFYASNNPKAAVMTGAAGAASFGLLSVWNIFTNGALIGVLSHEVALKNRLDYLWSSIAPHGVPEISGLVISGSAGLLLGWALLNPGRESRGESLRRAGPDAIVLLATGVLLMFVAAPIEAFFSFNPLVPGWVKTIVAVVTLGLWLTFWTRYGRDREVA